MENQFNENLEPSVQEDQNSTSIMTKGLIILGLTLLMLIPIPFILNLIEERKESQESVVNEVASKWSGDQVIYGPFLQINYNQISKNGNGKDVISNESLYVSPNENYIKSDVNNSIKNRSLYDVIVYNAKLNLKSSFSNFDKIIAESNLDPNKITGVKIIFAIKDDKGFEDKIVAKSGGNNYVLNYDDSINLFSEIIQIDEDLNKTINLSFLSKVIDYKSFDFKNVTMDFNIKGSNSLQFLPSAIRNHVEVSSNWKDLKFDGYSLPIDTTNLDGKYNATWKIYEQNPMGGQYWRNTNKVNSYSFGVNFLQMNDSYDKTYRSTKYAILFIGLTFVAFFFIENRNKFNIHIVQYTLVGFAICVNFVLLLSISEYLGFDIAYFISSVATLILISLFVYSFLKSIKLTSRISAILLLLYVFIYSVLQLKEHALLVGSIGLFIILAAVMFYSKNIEWNLKK